MIQITEYMRFFQILRESILCFPQNCLSRKINLTIFLINYLKRLLAQVLLVLLWLPIMIDVYKRQPAGPRGAHALR